MSGNYTYLINRLDAFIRKFYLNQVIRGVLWLVAVAGSMYLVFSLLEYYLYLSPAIRKLFFYGFLVISTALLAGGIILPLIRYFRLGKVMNYQTASSIIGSHFPEVEDRLLNILQLEHQSQGVADRSLIEASVEQKIRQIKPVPFLRAIDLRKNKKYLPYALPPLAVLFFLLFAAPNILRDSNYRLINNNEVFERAAPFHFMISNDPLEVIQYQDFELVVHLEGSVLPEAVAVETAAGSFPMTRTAPDTYTYVFRKVPDATDFHLLANGYPSSTYTLRVIPRPVVKTFRVELDYPDYTGRRNEVLDNTGDMSIPEGTSVRWVFSTEAADSVELFFGENKQTAQRDTRDRFVLEKTIHDGGSYAIGLANTYMYSNDTLRYWMQVIPDAYPKISVEAATDSSDHKYVFFLGNASDDYGISRTAFHYTLEKQDEQGHYRESDTGTDKVPFTRAGNQAAFTYAFDMNRFALQPGDRITYYFETWDNDGVHGPKATRTGIMQFAVPTLDELKDTRDANNDAVEEGLEKVLDELQDIRKDTRDLQEKFIQKKDLNWEDKKNVEDLLKRQNQLQEQLNQLQENFQKNLDMQQEYMQPEQQILEKQQQLQELFEEVMDEEMKQLYEELQKLLEELSREESLQEMEQMDLNNKELENELDRMLELFKQLQLEQQMQETIDELNELAEEQLELSEESKDKQSDVMDNIDKQEDINKQFEEISKDLEKLQEMNEDLENPKEMGDSEQQQQEISEHLEQSMEQLQNNKQKQASEQQQQAGEKMQQMAQQMQDQMQQQQQEQQQEDMRALSQLLDNLLKLSLDQEDLIYELQQTKAANPRYVELMNEQQRIKEDTRMVEDSLLALSKRVPDISSFVLREMAAVNKNLGGSLDALHERGTNQANVYQQYTMTGYNNLALMLDEVLQQLQQQMAQSMPGSQMCQKPGGSSELPSMSEMQKQLNEQLQQMKGQMSQGPKPGERQGMSQQLAQMAQQQAALREALQQLADELGGGNTEDGKLAKELREIADQMDKTEEDIVNKRLTEETLKRQEEILTRLLEAQDADRQRKTDNERQSNTADAQQREMPPALEEYLRKRQAELDQYKTVAPELKPYYKQLVEEYFRNGGW